MCIVHVPHCLCSFTSSLWDSMHRLEVVHVLVRHKTCWLLQAHTQNIPQDGLRLPALSPPRWVQTEAISAGSFVLDDNCQKKEFILCEQGRRWRCVEPHQQQMRWLVLSMLAVRFPEIEICERLIRGSNMQQKQPVKGLHYVKGCCYWPMRLLEHPVLDNETLWRVFNSAGAVSKSKLKEKLIVTLVCETL